MHKDIINMDINIYLIIGISVLAILSVMILIKYILIIKKYNPITNAQKEAKIIITKATEDAEKIISDSKTEYSANIKNSLELRDKYENDISILKNEYIVKKAIFDKLSKEVSIYEDKMNDIEIGFSEKDFLYDDSESYKVKINENIYLQKQLIYAKEAITCSTEWRVDNSISKGRKFINDTIKLTLRAFNSECDVIIQNVNWKNYHKSKDKILKSYDFFNQYNQSKNIIIQKKYLNLKLEELRLVFEEQERKQKEKDEQRAIRERIREEERLKKDAILAEKEEEKYRQLLDKAKEEALKSSGDKLEELNNKIKQLSESLEEAQEKNKRAISMAQQTKSGYVYIISNIGSFGENVFKIGMTRRLDPYDRVKELGDASVPFEFDVHAMIPCDDAPALEGKLHNKFEKYKINLINSRREFFKIPIDIVEKELKKELTDITFIKDVIAEQYYRSETLRSKMLEQDNKMIQEFPDSI